MNDLVPCPACNRHLRTSEQLCPFCGCPLPARSPTRAPAAPSRRRLSRSALFAAGATMMGAAACSSTTTKHDDAAVDTGAMHSYAGSDGPPGNDGAVPIYSAVFPPQKTRMARAPKPRR